MLQPHMGWRRCFPELNKSGESNLKTLHRIFSSHVGLTSRIENTFSPIADFRRTDADVIMIFIRSAVLYTAEISDPVFNATRQISGPGVGGPRWAFAVD